MRKGLPYLFVLLAFPGWTCKKENACDCVKGTGEITTETRQLPAFRNVFAEDNVNLIFIADSTEFVKVEAGKHLISLIKTEVVNNELRVRNDNRCNFMRRYDIPINVYVHVRPAQLFHVKSRATGNVTNEGAWMGDSLDLDIEGSGDISFNVGGGLIYTHQHGAGDITITGTCDQILIFSKGTGFTITDGCDNIYTWVYTNTTGKITVNPEWILTTIIEGPGNIYYRRLAYSVSNTEHSTGRLLPLQ
jgi:hypothetical protein